MGAEAYVGPPVTVGEVPAAHPLMLQLLVRLARAVALQDAVKEKTGEPKIGDLVVEMSSWSPVSDPDSIGWLRGFDTDDTDGRIFWIEPLFAPSGTPWVSWGNASFLTLHERHWRRLGIGGGQ